MLNVFWILIGVGMCITAVQCDSEMESSIRDILTKRRYLKYARKVLDDFNNQLDNLHKRSCVLNLPGMDCEYGDISGSGKDQDFWTSGRTPGKKRRSYCNLGLGNSEECLTKQLKDDMTDFNSWNDKFRPGKK
ncbi:uncharacterized protein LOC111621259 isoform X1 [Centruroides sculpturatus]|uniref:uncharacterized protein LOC111621259 isoform X1 n=1 Tax=Centruroides sculpturatus TaxID=218467 RepID=UPI000C6D39A8|nr:uncharacterized protein LOC111621259 isoform X1 [Centruroides sculpturatus]XP_023219109.1 uncharacterized protein LOC111621259 isoform X1 [Centruroides sculpturatus]